MSRKLAASGSVGCAGFSRIGVEWPYIAVWGTSMDRADAAATNPPPVWAVGKPGVLVVADLAAFILNGVCKKHSCWGRIVLCVDCCW